MKKIFIILLSAVFTGFILTACTEDCKNCKSVTKDSSGNIIQEGTSSEYCDTALDEKENADPVTVGGNTTAWVCE